MRAKKLLTIASILFTYSNVSHSEVPVFLKKYGFIPTTFIQLWGVHENAPGAYQGSSGRTSQHTDLVLRRSEIAFGKAQESGFEWGFMMDPSRGINNTLAPVNQQKKIIQDVFVGYAFNKAFKLRAGQGLLPTNLEGLTAPGELLLPERSWQGQRLGNQRDVGVMILGAHNKISYELGAYTGNGQYSHVKKDPKLFIGRLNFFSSKDLHLGVWVAKKTETNAAGTQDSSGADVLYKFGLFQLRTEASVETSHQLRKGYFTQLGYTPSDRHILALRYDYFEGNRESKDVGNAIEIGHNMYFESIKNLKWQSSYRTGNEGTVDGKRKFHVIISGLNYQF